MNNLNVTRMKSMMGLFCLSYWITKTRKKKKGAKKTVYQWWRRHPCHLKTGRVRENTLKIIPKKSEIRKFRGIRLFSCFRDSKTQQEMKRLFRSWKIYLTYISYRRSYPQIHLLWYFNRKNKSQWGHDNEKPICADSWGGGRYAVGVFLRAER